MSDVSTFLREYAGREWPAMNHKGRMAQLARLLRMTYRRVCLALKHTFGFRTRISIARKWQASARDLIRDANEMTPDVPNLSTIPHHGSIGAKESRS